MITNHLLQAKYQIQKELESDAQHDLNSYVQNMRRMAKEAEAQYKVKFKYGTVEKSQDEEILAKTG